MIKKIAQIIIKIIVYYIMFLSFVYTILSIFKENNILVDYSSWNNIVVLLVFFITPLILGLLTFFIAEQTFFLYPQIDLTKYGLGEYSGLRESGDIGDKNEIDNYHHYNFIKRYDYLDYSKPDYISIRDISIFNKRKANSLYLPYTECCDILISFKEIDLKAINKDTGKELEIVPLYKDVDHKKQRHAFRIYFNNQLCKNDTFNILLYIKIPNELQVIKDSINKMGISFVRIKKGIDKFGLSVFLNYEPKHYSSHKRNKKFESLTNRIKATLETTDIKNQFEKYFPIDISNMKALIELGCEKPKSEQYIISYNAKN